MTHCLIHPFSLDSSASIHHLNHDAAVIIIDFICPSSPPSHIIARNRLILQEPFCILAVPPFC